MCAQYVLVEHNPRNRFKKIWIAKNTTYIINNFTTVIQICYIFSPVIQSIKANAQIEVLYKRENEGGRSEIKILA